MSERVDVREYVGIDRTDVIELIVSIQRDEFGVAITAAQQPDLSDVEHYYQTGNGNFWVAQHDGRVVGTIALKDIGAAGAALRKMFVSPGYRGRDHGTAGRLLRTALAWSRARGLATIHLGTTAQFLAAHRFYEKNGFVEVARSQLPPSFPVMDVDTKFYRYSL
ncbi:MAG: GNAT family N-acetyltransferase [Rhodoplanes sp.]|uniref:GNAT family N-acetyltransferase n=1 Tax=Rhodoplanes sp. TaxID=1968906 RepID=UPI0018115E9A|nr:GNAT family N-acetyltransferase [Rhodoplanes sp.]NVO14319.1 GNAT family N-acetyltransferase [Rhodoplanes sp.]